MLTQCSVFESQLKGGVESPIKALDGNQTSYPAARYKSVLFFKTTDESGIQAMIDLLRANIDTMMATLDWPPGNQTSIFFWDFDINPVLDPTHSMGGAPPFGGGPSGYNSDHPVTPQPTDPGFLFDQTGFRLQVDTLWHIKTVGPLVYAVYASWILYNGPSKMQHSYNKFIGDPSFLQPPAPIAEPPPMLSGQAGYGSTTIPVDVINPLPFANPQKMPIPDYKTDYFNENNIWRAL